MPNHDSVKRSAERAEMIVGHKVTYYNGGVHNPYFKEDEKHEMGNGKVGYSKQEPKLPKVKRG